MKNLLFAFLLLFIFGCESSDEFTGYTTNSGEFKDLGEPFKLKLLSGAEICMQKSVDDFVFIECLAQNQDIKSEFTNKFIKSGEKKPTIFFFFTTWCPACKSEFALFNEISKNAAINVIGVLLEEKPEAKVREFIKNNKIEFEVAFDGAKSIASALGGVAGTPYILLLDENRKIVAKYIGKTDKNELLRALRK